MADYRAILERDIKRVEPPSFGLGQLGRRRDRRVRDRRVRAALLGLALAAISIAAASRLVGLGRNNSVPATPGNASKPGIWAVDPLTGSATLVWGPNWLAPPGDLQRVGNVIGAPSISPDGSRIAFTLRRKASPDPRIYTVDADGTDPKKVTHCARPFFCPSSWGPGTWPAWSPDGTRIAFTGGPNSREDPSDVYAIAANGGHPRILARQPGEADDVDWSPDGTRIVFDNLETDGTLRIVVASIPQGKTTRLFEGGSMPLWSPGGEWIAFRRDVPARADGLKGIWVIRPDGNGARYLASGEFPVSWSPDGKHVAILQSQAQVTPTSVDRRYSIVDSATGQSRTIQVRCVGGAELFFAWPSGEA